MERMDNNNSRDSTSTFVSANSGDTDSSFFSCSTTEAAPTVYNNSQNLDEDEEGLHALNDSPVDYDMEEPGEETVRIDNESPDQGVETEAEREKTVEDEDIEYEAMLRRVLECTDDCNARVMENTVNVRSLTTKVENEAKDVIHERDQALMDLRGVEQAFSDVHRKYERAKTVLENLKVNEEHLRQRDEEFQLLIAARDDKHQAFKQEMEQTLEKMYNDYSAKLAAVEAENGKLSVLHRRAEMRVETLGAELAHKQKENAALNVLADDLIGKSAKM